MGNQGLSIAAGIAQGVDNAVKNLYAVQTAKAKLKQEQEMHDADLKVKKATLEKMELAYGPEQLAAEREKLKAETAAQNALFNLRTVQISREQKKQEQELESYKRSVQIFDKALKIGTLPAGTRINSKGDWSMAGPGINNTGTVINLGTEDNSGPVNPNNDVEDFLAGIK
jgi:hypothetical protein